MATIIEITDHKMECLSECAEKVLKYGGKLMSALEEIGEGKYGSRYGSRYGSKNMENEEDEYEKRYGARHRFDKEYSRYY